MTTQPKLPIVLIVDDDKNTRDGLERALSGTFRLLLAEDAQKALQFLGANEVDIMLSDVRMPGMDGLTLMNRAMANNPRLVCILLTAYGNVETAVEAMKNGAYDFLMKPVNLDHLDLLLKRAIRSRDIENENITLRQQLDNKYGLENIIGQSASMLQLYDVIRQAAPSQASVLIQGESGTGKELVAHAIHRLSLRARGAFVAVHCASLSPTILESELFGHEKGAFTGAISRRRGRFELADSGTLFLDEISEIDASVQVKLLRVLEERKFERVGGTETVEVDLRLIAATNKDLRKMVEEKKFRDDLFFRLDVVNIVIPPLRDRLDDIPLLCDQFIKEFAARNNKVIEGISIDAVNILSQHKWPGNVRELRNTIEKMVVLSGSRKLTARDIPSSIRDATRLSGVASGIALSPPVPAEGGKSDSLAEIERKMIHMTLKRNGNNVTKAAKELGVSRRTLHRKLNLYKVDHLESDKGETLSGS